MGKKNPVKEELLNYGPSAKKNVIFTLSEVNTFVPDKNGVDLDSGYEFELNCALPQLASGLSALFIEMDKQKDMGKKAGGTLLMLVQQYYSQKGGKK